MGGTWDAIAQAQRELATFNPELRYRGFRWRFTPACN